MEKEYFLFDGMSIDANGLNNIVKYEGFRELPYKCDAGVRTIGYGTTIDKDFSSTAPFPYNVLFAEYMNWGIVTHRTAYSALEFLVEKYMKQLTHSEKYHINFKPLPHETQNQYNAIASLVYNVGANALSKAELFSHTIVDYFKYRNNTVSLVNIWMQFAHVKGKIHTGLQKRRKEEVELFLLD